jgi:Methylamine utilisation protein MauE
MVDVLRLAEPSRLVLQAVFLLAAVDVAKVLASGSGRWHPMILASPWRRARADLLLAASLVADITSLILVEFAPRVGAVLIGVLLVVYTGAARRVHSSGPGRGCRCLGRFMNTSSLPGLVARNAFLLGFVFLTFFGSHDPGGDWISDLAIGAILTTAVAGVTHLVDVRAGSRREAAYLDSQGV